MKIRLPLVLSCLLLVAGAHAQTLPPGYRHSIGVGLEHVGLDAPDGEGNRGLLNYSRHFRNDRLVVGANLGYVNALNRKYLPGTNDFYVYGKRRERITADFTAAFDFLRHPRHAFRLGAGPSLWYRQDELFDGGRYTVNLTTGQATNVNVRWRQEKEWNFGYNVLVEYEYALTKQVLVSGKLKFFDSRKAGQSTIYGFGLGYRFGQ